jgi:hypothetical protein
MQRTTNLLTVRVGDAKYPINLTDSAVEAVQGEAAGKAVDAFGSLWSVQERIDQGDGFDSLVLSDLLEMREALQTACEVVDVLIECRPLDEVDLDR